MTPKSGFSPAVYPDEKYKPGQVWKYQTRARESDSTVTILRVDSFGYGDVNIHVRLEGLQMKDLPNDSSITVITHAPITKEAMDRSVTELIREGDPIPDFESEYQIWLADDGSGVFTVVLAEVVDLIEDTWNTGTEG